MSNRCQDSRFVSTILLPFYFRKYFIVVPETTLQLSLFFTFFYSAIISLPSSANSRPFRSRLEDCSFFSTMRINRAIITIVIRQQPPLCSLTAVMLLSSPLFVIPLGIIYSVPVTWLKYLFLHYSEKVD